MENDQLCNVCQNLDFPKDGIIREERIPSALSHGIVPLGQIQDIRKKTWCSFCRLVISQIFDGPTPVDVESNKEIQLLPSTDGYAVYGTRLGTFIWFVVSEPIQGYRPNTLRMIHEKEININMVKKWLEMCETHHTDKCIPSRLTAQPAGRLRSLPPIRAVDLMLNCVTEIPLQARYITLSYVWGDVPSIRLAKRNLATFMTRNSLVKIRQSLPRTINDALDFVTLLGERYLWIDSLCLVSDDEEEMRNGIQSMDMIYEGSTLNIIAAAGFDASAGLPGVRYGSRRVAQQIEEVQPGVCMAVYEELLVYLSASRYYTRGWTFQEQILPKRSLVFVNDQVYWRCRVAEWSEHTNVDKWPTKYFYTTSTLLYEALDEEMEPLWTYDLLLLYYSRRKLTYELDTINAIAGLLERLEIRMATRFFQGLPRATFDFSILFVPDINESKDSSTHRRLNFPSYTWAGWRNSIQHPHLNSLLPYLSNWLAESTWIIWYELDPSGAVILVWNPEVEGIATDIGKHIRYPEKRQGRLRRFASFASEFPTKPRNPAWPSGSVSPRTYPLLGFWTMAVFLNVASSPSVSEDIWVYDSRNKPVGVADLKTDLDLTNGCILEFLILSDCVEPRLNSSVTWPQNWPLSTPKLGKRDTDSQWNLFWALVVANVNGCMERIGLARIYQTALTDSFPPGPVWKETILG